MGPSELGIVFKNHLKLLAQHDVPSGHQSAAEEGLQRDRERAPTINPALNSFSKKIVAQTHNKQVSQELAAKVASVQL